MKGLHDENVATLQTQQQAEIESLQGQMSEHVEAKSALEAELVVAQNASAELTTQTEAMSALQDHLMRKEEELAEAQARTDDVKSKAKVTFQGLKEQKITLVRGRNHLTNGASF